MQRMFSACKRIQEHGKNGIFWRTNSSTAFKAEHEASPFWDVTGLNRLGHLSMRERRGHIMDYHGILFHLCTSNTECIALCIRVSANERIRLFKATNGERQSCLLSGCTIDLLQFHCWTRRTHASFLAVLQSVLVLLSYVLRQAMATCCISYEAWLCHSTCSIRQSRHMLTWEVNSQVIHRLCCFLLQAKPVCLVAALHDARCTAASIQLDSKHLKTLSEDYDNQTRECQSMVFLLPKSCFIADECISPKRLAVRNQRDQNGFDFVFQPKMLNLLSIGSSQNVITLFPGVSAFEWVLTLDEEQSCIDQGS